MNDYNYDYEENTYFENKENALEQTNHNDITVLIMSSDLFEKSVYYINTFYMCTTINTYSCCLCKTVFKLNNKLHHYIYIIYSKIKKIKLIILSSKFEFKLIAVTLFSLLSVNIVELNIFNTVSENECEFQNWHYITIFFQFSVKDFIKSACLNTECIMFLVDKQFLCQHLLNLSIQQSVIKITVWDIDNKTHKCQKYVHLNLYLSDVLAETMRLIYIIWDIHLIDNLQTNLLIEINIIDSEQININISFQKTIIEECQGLLTIINIISQKNNQICWIIQISAQTIIFIQFIHLLTVKTEKHSFFNDWDLIFNLFYQEVSNYIINANLFFIYVWNDLTISVTLSHYMKLKIIIKYKKEDCYTDNIKNFEFVTL